MPDISPTALVVNPDGTISASFTGKIHAQGLDIDAGTNVSPPNTNRVRWVRTSDGALVADIYGYDVGAANLNIEVGDVPGEHATLTAIAKDDSGQSGLFITQDALFSAISAQINNAAAKVLLDGSGNSDWPQLVNRGNVHIAFGVGGFSWSANQDSSVTTVTHNLGKIPVAFLATCDISAGGPEGPNPITAQTVSGSATTTQVSFQGRCQATITGSHSFYWLVIG